jgi:hypothetical protein
MVNGREEGALSIGLVVNGIDAGARYFKDAAGIRGV